MVKLNASKKLINAKVKKTTKNTKVAKPADPANPIGQKKWKNKQRALLISSRGVSYLARHVILNLKTLLPHARTESKFNRKHGLIELGEIADIRNCTKVIYIEMHKKQDAFMWISGVPSGPSVKFAMENMHTMEELKLTGNCLKGTDTFFLRCKSM